MNAQLMAAAYGIMQGMVNKLDRAANTNYGGNNEIYGGAGFDTIDCVGGNNWVQAGSGGATIHGGTGNDWLLAGNGAGSTYTIYGGSGTEKIYGGPGTNIIYGGGLNDLLVGGTGPDAKNCIVPADPSKGSTQASKSKTAKT